MARRRSSKPHPNPPAGTAEITRRRAAASLPSLVREWCERQPHARMAIQGVDPEDGGPAVFVVVDVSPWGGQFGPVAEWAVGLERAASLASHDVLVSWRWGYPREASYVHPGEKVLYDRSRRAR